MLQPSDQIIDKAVTARAWRKNPARELRAGSSFSDALDACFWHFPETLFVSGGLLILSDEIGFHI